VVAALQFKEQAGAAIVVPLVTSCMSLGIGFYALRRREALRFSGSDYMFAGLALASLGAWLFVGSPALAIVLLTLTDMFAFAPTVRKFWRNPHTEAWFMYGVCAARYILALMIMEQYNLVTVLYPAAWVIANLLFCGLIVYRQRTVAKTDMVTMSAVTS
jgi:hypothetical protein